MRIRLSALTSAAFLLLAFLPALFAQNAPKPAGAANRTSDGKPDFSGSWREGGGGRQGQAEKSDSKEGRCYEASVHTPQVYRAQITT